MFSPVVILVSAEAEWKVVCERYTETSHQTPFGTAIEVANGDDSRLIFVFGGWGKISAAASAQYAIDTWKPELLINLGTCGGFAGRIEVGDVILAEKTIVYDIIEQMGDADEAIDAYSTNIDTAWAGNDLPAGVRRGLLLSADKDIVHHEIDQLQQKYDGLAADWESGAIAWVAARNSASVLILRGVTDIVDGASGQGEAYGDISVFNDRTSAVVNNLLDQLPFWLERWRGSRS